MEEKKYQVFVSATFKDLENERKAAIEAIIELGHMPASMEYFTASSDEQFDYIKDVIDNCDYYVLIVAAYSGSKHPQTGKSYTEMEYDYAIEKGIPLLAFPSKYTEDKTLKDPDMGYIQKFRERITKGAMCKFWENTDQLRYEVSRSLSSEMKKHPQMGWQRFIDKTPLLEEINELRKERELLMNENKQLKELATTQCPEIKDIATLDDEYEFSVVYFYASPGSLENEKSTKDIAATWVEIFSYVGPFFPIKTEDFHNCIYNFIASKYSKILGHTFLVDIDISNTIRIQFEALKLITKEQGVLTLTSQGEYFLFSVKTKKAKVLD